MYCKKCGKQMGANDKFCPVCGEPLDIEIFPEKYSNGDQIGGQDAERLVQISFLKMVLLSCVTCGIYSIYAFYKFTKNVNILCEGDGRESHNYFVVILLGMITCGIYTFYWIYQQAQRMYDIAPKYKCRINITGTKMLLWDTFGNLIIIGPLVVWYYMLKNMNQLVEQFNHGVIDESYQLPNNKKNIKKPVLIIAVYYLLLISYILLLTLLSLKLTDVGMVSGGTFESDIATKNSDKDNGLAAYMKDIIGLVINPGTVKPADVAENILNNKEKENLPGSNVLGSQTASNMIHTELIILNYTDFDIESVRFKKGRSSGWEEEKYPVIYVDGIGGPFSLNIDRTDGIWEVEIGDGYGYCVTFTLDFSNIDVTSVNGYGGNNILTFYWEGEDQYYCTLE